jgi:hypothetical protein
MTTVPEIVAEAETYVRVLADEVTRPLAGECLCCYVARQLGEFDCDGTHRHAERYRDAVAPRATALVDRLRSVGACCCDCELFLNGYWPTHGAEPLPACAGVRRGSVRPCSKWERLRRR